MLALMTYRAARLMLEGLAANRFLIARSPAITLDNSHFANRHRTFYSRCAAKRPVTPILLGQIESPIGHRLQRFKLILRLLLAFAAGAHSIPNEVLAR